MSTTDRPTAGTRAPNSRTELATGPLMGWRGIDFVTTAVLGVAFGVVFLVWDNLFQHGWELLTAGFPPAGSFALGVWLLPAVAGGLLVRRPGAAFMCEMVAALLECAVGNQWGAAVLISGVLQGVGAELGFAAFGYRRFGPAAAMLSGALSAIVPICLYEWWFGMAEYAWGWRFFALGFAALSGVLIAGLGAWALIRALAGAGAINAFPAGREHLAGTSGARRA